ncbi:hypothetical protein IWW47_006087 [Coemansia sp. RSA 2052]|nr:hypothetical protein IWW47_006087 [Coemansia sp. RSA 2052]
MRTGSRSTSSSSSSSSRRRRRRRPWCTPIRLGPMAATLHNSTTQLKRQATWRITLKSTTSTHHSTSNNTMRRRRHSISRRHSHSHSTFRLRRNHRRPVAAAPLPILSQRLGTTGKSRHELGLRRSTSRPTNSSSSSNSNNASSKYSNSKHSSSKCSSRRTSSSSSKQTVLLILARHTLCLLHLSSKCITRRQALLRQRRHLESCSHLSHVIERRPRRRSLTTRTTMTTATASTTSTSITTTVMATNLVRSSLMLCRRPRSSGTLSISLSLSLSSTSSTHLRRIIRLRPRRSRWSGHSDTTRTAFRLATTTQRASQERGQSWQPAKTLGSATPSTPRSTLLATRRSHQ